MARRKLLHLFLDFAEKRLGGRCGRFGFCYLFLIAYQLLVANVGWLSRSCLVLPLVS